MSSSALRIQLVQEAADTPVSLSEAALHCRIDSTTDHSALQQMVRAATRVAEQYLRRPIMTQTFKQFFDAWPCDDFIELRRSPLISVTHVKTYDDADAATTWASSNYFVDTVSQPGRIVVRSTSTWPTYSRTANPIEIQYRAGFGTAPSDIPADIRQAVLMLTANLYEHRGETITGTITSEAKEGAFDLLSAYREVMV